MRFGYWDFKLIFFIQDADAFLLNLIEISLVLLLHPQEISLHLQILVGQVFNNPIDVPESNPLMLDTDHLGDEAPQVVVAVH